MAGYGLKHKDYVEPGEIAISVKGVSKTFVVPHEKHNSLKSVALNMFAHKSYDKFEALRDVSFDIKRGEFFGIIGRNGSGKSTLLKILAGIYVPDSGRVTISGKLSPFLELGVGFNPELTGRENLFLGGAILGLTSQEVAEKYDRIVAFSELEEFMDMKLKNYSSGMQVRLAFALAINARAEILLMDEVLAVGDVNFQAKCLEEFEKYKAQDKTVILVTHDIATAQKHCDKLMILDKGVIKSIGDPNATGDLYLKMIMDKEEKRLQSSKTKAKTSSKKPSIKKVEFLDKENNPKRTFKTGDEVKIRVYFTNPTNITKLNFGIAIFDLSDKYIFGVNTIDDKISTEVAIDRGFYEISYRNLPLRTGEDYIKTAVRGVTNSSNYDYMEKSDSFKVYSGDIREGLVELDYKWQ